MYVISYRTRNVLLHRNGETFNTFWCGLNIDIKFKDFVLGLYKKAHFKIDSAD